tara:strand:+ start:134 stop:388 length:255 start_codon:yes stop_codon:yes gene_type:complete
MDKQNIESLKKRIFYRCSHTGTRETDLLFKKLIIKKINKLEFNDLIQLSNLFLELSDQEIFLILNNINKPLKKHIKIFDILKNE